ncbi:MAG: hypothetical protein H0V56_08920, partial [Chthoniobacterales bacterium]|nr:hypothetical protein [Chthoniobacterales bacterium]
MRVFLLAALAAFAVNLAAKGSRAVETVTVTPDTLRLEVGDVGRLTCAPRNGFGSLLTNTCSWTSKNTVIATTTSSSQNVSVTARANGTTFVTATSKGKADTAVIIVGTPPPPDTTTPPDT